MLRVNLPRTSSLLSMCAMLLKRISNASKMKELRVSALSWLQRLSSLPKSLKCSRFNCNNKDASSKRRDQCSASKDYLLAPVKRAQKFFKYRDKIISSITDAPGVNLTSSTPQSMSRLEIQSLLWQPKNNLLKLNQIMTLI